MGIIIRQSLKGTFANYLGIAIGFFTVFFVLTRYLTPEEVGLTRILVDAGILFSGLAQLGTNSSAIRFYPYFKDERSGDHGFFGWTLIVPLIGFLIYLILFLCFKTTIIKIYEPKSALFTQYVHLLVPLAFFMLYQAVFEVNANVLMRIAVPKFVREVGVRLMTLVCYMLYAYNVLDLDWFVFAFCGVYAVAMLCDFIYLLSLKKISFRIDKSFISPELKKDFLFYTLFMITAALAGNIMPTISTFFVGAKMGLFYTGIFAIANYISAVIEAPYRSLGAIAQPEISQYIKNGDSGGACRLCKSVSLHQLLAGSFIFFIIWINIDLLFYLIPNGNDYAAGKWVVFILGMSRLLNSTLSVGVTVLNYSKYYYYSLLFTLMLTVTAIFLNLQLIPRYGIYGVAFASFAAYALYFALLLWVVWRSIHVNPFSFAQVKISLVMLLMFAFNALWYHFLTPEFSQSTGIMLAEAVVRTLFFVLVIVWLTYKIRISSEVNRLIDKYILRKTL